MNAAILGGGVAGIGSAIALAQEGFDVSVYERHESASNIGAGIMVWPNAAYVLEQLGVLNDVEAIAGQPTTMRRLSSSGDPLGAIDIGLINQRMGYRSLSVLRSEFQKILMARLESLGVAVQYAHVVTDIGTTDRGDAEVHFQNGARITADVLVGADGRMASHARQYVHGDNAPVYQGHINWIGVFESGEEIFQEIAIADYWGVGKRFGIVPVTRRQAYWAGGLASAGIGPGDPARYLDELRCTFSGWPGPVQRMIGETPVDRINKIYVHDHDPIREWHRNNLVVIGDAAHAALPTSGQGACQALEDAWHLVGCLKDNPHDLQKAFVAFTDIRSTKTANMTVAARGLASSLFHQDVGFCRARNERSRSTDYAGVAEGMSRAWAQHLPLID